MDPQAAYEMTFRQLAAAHRGYEIRRREEWERFLMMVNAWTGQGLTYDKLTGRTKPIDREYYERLKRRADAASR